MQLPRHAELWGGGLVRSWWRDRGWQPTGDSPPTVWLLFTDHFEPCGGGVTHDVAMRRVNEWTTQWPVIAERTRDSFGRKAQYTFFYPAEEYDREVVDRIAGLVHDGFGELEVHLHHDRDTPAHFLGMLEEFVTRLHREHGVLRLGGDGRPAWCFIHGNWALDNSHPEGRWCGLNNELTLLRQAGCRADFTLPSAPSGCQTSLVNAIYWAVDDPARPKSHDRGPLLRPGVAPPADALLMVQGPLTLRRHPRYPLLPSLEVGELAGYALPTPARIDAWLRSAPRVGNHIFVKLFGHGAQERNGPPLLAGGGLQRCLEQMKSACEARGFRLGYLTAWEAATLLEDLAAGRCAPGHLPAWHAELLRR